MPGTACKPDSGADRSAVRGDNHHLAWRGSDEGKLESCGLCRAGGGRQGRSMCSRMRHRCRRLKKHDGSQVLTRRSWQPAEGLGTLCAWHHVPAEARPASSHRPALRCQQFPCPPQKCAGTHASAPRQARPGAAAGAVERRRRVRLGRRQAAARRRRACCLSGAASHHHAVLNTSSACSSS